MSLTGATTFQWEPHNKADWIMYKYPRNINVNDNVVVQEDEYAIFFRDGKALHTFNRPGRYALTTQNVPILKSILKGVAGVEQVGAIYYLQKREMRGKFGTKEPLTFRDKDFGLVRIRIFGKFSYKVVDPMLLITQMVGTKGYSHSQEVVDWLRDQIVMSLNDILGELKKKQGIGVADLPAYLEEIEQILLARLKDETPRYGLEIPKVVGINFNLPEEVQKAVDSRASMGILGTSYMEYQTAQALRDMGKSGGGGAAATGMGLGAGMGMGMQMPGMIAQGQAKGPPPVPGSMNKCPKCGGDVPGESKFCGKCGASTEVQKKSCVKCSADIADDARFCKSCGADQTVAAGKACTKCGTSLAADAQFCKNCGEKQVSGSKRCSKCGIELAADAKFCKGCGQAQ